jgi:NitT/TauT family transport system substrate-binding protein
MLRSAAQRRVSKHGQQAFRFFFDGEREGRGKMKFRMMAAAAALALLVTPALAQEKVRIGQATAALSFTPIWAARALDTFKAQGLDLQWSTIAGGDPTTLAALDSGDIDFAAVGSETALQAIAKGQPFQLVYSLMSTMTLELVVSNDFLARTGVSPADPLDKRIKALKGAMIGVSAVRGAQDRVARWLIQQGGLDPMADLKVANIGAPPAIRAALENKQIDGFVLSPPEGVLTEQSKAGKVLVKLGREFPDLQTLHFLVLVAKRPVDGAKRELAIKTMRALMLASAETMKDPARVSGEIQSKFFPKVEPAIIAAAIDSMKPGVTRGGRFAANEIAYLLKFTADTGGAMEKQLDPAQGEGQFWTNAFIDAAKQ